MTHGSLFSGIGGFDLAASWIGWRNIFQVEKDEYCLKVLEKNFNNVMKYKDIKEFDGTIYRGAVDIISGGFPCQPFSIAGQRRGRDDDRHLWPEMYRVITETRPRWVVAENVYGILNIEGGLVFEQVCSDLEREGYEVQPFIIPAISKNAPHRRDRVWIIAHSDKNREMGKRRNGNSGNKEWDETQDVQEREDIKLGIELSDTGIGSSNTERLERRNQYWNCPDKRVIIEADNDIANHSIQGLEGRMQSGMPAEYNRWQNARWDKNWIEVATELCSVDDGLPVELGGFKLSKSAHRKHQLMAYGNAIVPQVAYEIFRFIDEVEEVPF